MNGFNYILSKQIGWANRNEIPLVGSKITKGRQAYTKTLSHNLFEPLLAQTKIEIDGGDGGELKGSATHSAKMCAVHSSSAIGVNILQYWKNKNVSDIAYVLGLCRKDNYSANELHFEQKFQISNKFQFSPNIDAIIENDDNSAIKIFGIECKFSEAYSSRTHPGLKERYISEIKEHWNNIPELFKLAKEISPNDKKYNHLHPAQLIKHILGLKRAFGKSGFRLLYLWYDVFGKEGYQHREEIKQFSDIAKSDNIKFHSISYQELIIKMKNELYSGNEKYINYMMDRYL
jgi:hypothetical protein|tara:strand:+ start:1400 stop:2266 length:867 start_codon:yes stop_codon:yes gene_type:complete